MPFVVAGLAIAAAWLGRTSLTRVASLYPGALPSHPYWVPEHWALLYIVVPATVAATVVMLLTPGGLLLLALGGDDRAGSFVLKAFGAAFGVRILVHGAMKLSGMEPFPARAFFLTEAAVDTSLAVLALWRMRRGLHIAWPFSTTEGRRRALWFTGIPAVLVAALLPAFFWQDLSDDGLEALEIGRSLFWHIVPRFPGGSGFASLGEGMLAMAFPIHWFEAVVGPWEVAARLPLTLYLPVLFLVLLELIEWKAARPLRAAEEGAILVALGTYVAAMAYNSTYYPYAADLSSPGTSFETLTVLCMSATVLFLWNGRTGWMLGFAVLGYLARPTEVMMLVLLAVAAGFTAGEERQRWLLRLGLGLATCLALRLTYEHIYLPHAMGVVLAGGHGLTRLQYLTFTDVRRLVYVAVPSGVLPVLSLGAWRRQDRWARQITLCSVAYFLFFYAQAFIALHHFVPAMILPLVVFWRIHTTSAARWPPVLATAAAAVCLVASLPRSFAVDRLPRRIGCETSYRVGSYGGSDWTGHHTALLGRASLRPLFSEGMGAYPYRDLIMTPLALIYYSTRCATDPRVAVYLAQPAADRPPAGAVLIAADSLAAVYVRDTTRWSWDRRHPPATDPRSALYAIPRSTLHRFLGIPAHQYQLNLASLPFLWRIF